MNRKRGTQPRPPPTPRRSPSRSPARPTAEHAPELDPLHILLAKTPEVARAEAERELTEAQRLVDRILTVPGPRTPLNTLRAFEEGLILAHRVRGEGSILKHTHPDREMRQAGEWVYETAEQAMRSFFLNPRLYRAFKEFDASKESKEVRFAVEKTLREFRRTGGTLPDDERAAVRSRFDHLSRECITFERQIAEDVRSIELVGRDLEGLPDDYVHARRVKGSALRIRVTTAYPDSMPLLRYARSRAARRRMTEAMLSRGFPNNAEPLEKMLRLRYDIARRLGREDWASYSTEDKMIGSRDEAAAFIKRIAQIVEAPKERDRSELDKRLVRERRTEDGSEPLSFWDLSYLTNRERAERLRVDGKEVRQYFEYRRTRDGILKLAQDLFGLVFRRTKGAKVWHPSVEAYDVFHSGARVGRVFLDMHPREGKYTHAMQETVVAGVAGRHLPQAALVCNFADPSREPEGALLDHSQVTVFLHEFGHLVHAILAGSPKWFTHRQDALEWDFIEVPSMMLEEWAFDPETLGRFALHHKTGLPIPADLVDRMRRSDAFGRGILAANQVAFSAISLELHRGNPSGTDVAEVARRLWNEHAAVPWVPETHLELSFGHLSGYSAFYYTYLWSISIARDVLRVFRDGRPLLDPAEGRRWASTVLAPGSSRPAMELIKSYLGREIDFGAIGDYLTATTEEGASPPADERVDK